MSSVTPASHTDLHGLVDGHLDSERRTATLRRLAAFPADRARVEAWQGQNDLLRSSFAGVEREPLPAMLDLTSKSRLQCIPANDAPLVAQAAPAGAASGPRGRLVAAIVTIIVMVAGLAGSWFLQEGSRHEQMIADARESTIEATAPATVAASGIDKLLTTEIPDLHAVGFRFIGAETTVNPPTVVFRYEAGPDRISVRVTRAAMSTDGSTTVKEDGHGVRWQTRNKSFAMSGSVQQDRLHDVAAALQKGSSAR